MKSIKNKIFFGLACMMLSVTSNATYEWDEGGTVLRYYPATGLTYIRMSAPAPNSAGCKNNYYYVIDREHVERDEYRKMILTAMSTGKRLRIAVDKAPGTCVGSYPKVNRMYLY